MENQEHNSSINLRTRSSPKALESYLYNHQGSQQFNMHCYVGKDALEKLVKEIRKQNERIRTASNKHLPQAQNKYVAIGMASLIAMDNIKKIQEERKNKNQEPLNPLESCLYLLNEVLPKMKVSTGETFTTPTSYKSVISLARNLGIFQKDIEDYAKRPEDQKIPSAPSTPRKPS